MKMSNYRKTELKGISLYVLLGIIILCAFVGIGFTIYVYITYGNMSFDELPAWVIPFFVR